MASTCFIKYWHVEGAEVNRLLPHSEIQRVKSRSRKVVILQIDELSAEKIEMLELLRIGHIAEINHEILADYSLVEISGMCVFAHICKHFRTVKGHLTVPVIEI